MSLERRHFLFIFLFLVFFYVGIFIYFFFHFFSFSDGDLSVIVGNMCDGDEFDNSQI